MFTATEFLTPQQVASYFSRLASKSKGLVSTTSEDIQEEELDDTEETGALLLHVLDKVGLRHPVMSHTTSAIL